MPTAEIYYGGDKEYSCLWDIRDRFGVTWRWMLIAGAKFLTEHDVIGENAPAYLECSDNRDRLPAAWLDTDRPDHAAQRIDVADFDLEHIQIEVTLIGLDTDQDEQTETAAETEEADTELPTDPQSDDEVTEPPPTTNEAAGSREAAEEGEEPSATSAESAPSQTDSENHQSRARSRWTPATDPGSFQKESNDD